MLLTASCAPTRASEKKSAEKSGPAAVLPSGARYPLEIVATPEFRAQGLMFRESLAERHGMLFLFPRPSVESFWMKNCNFPIDIVWMDESRKVTFVSANTPPCAADPCPTYGPKAAALFVLEIPAGAAAKEKIAVGSVLKFENVPGPPKE
jgi:uncharacterized membrane protein (UPF0127 family)